jgi:hypothetical protein
MRDYFAGEDGMQMILDQLRQNPRMEISSITTKTWPLCGCFDDTNVERLQWHGAELRNGDVVYCHEPEGLIFKVRIRVERIDPGSEEGLAATIEANIENHLRFMKKQREGQACTNCDVPFAEEGL